MGALFSGLTDALYGMPLIALGAAFVWGVLSVLLSPCHLAGIPLLVGYINGQERIKPVRAFSVSLLFAVGILVSIVAIGVITAAAGRMMGDIGSWGNYLVALLFFLVGLSLLGVIPLGWSAPKHVVEKHKGLFAAFMMGLVFGIALGPCSFAYMAPLLGIALALGAEQSAYACGLLLSFGIGHCAVIVLAGTSAGLVQHYLDWNKASHGTLIVKRICGVLLLLAGLYLIYVAP